MKMITIQHNNAVINSIKNKGMFTANKEYSSDIKICPKLIESTIKKNNNQFPIFTLIQHFVNQNVSAYNKISEMPGIILSNMSSIILGLDNSPEDEYNDYNLFLLDVPDEIVYCTSLWGWRNLMIFEKVYNNIIDENDEDSEWYGTWSLEPIKDEGIQGIIPYIKQDFILDSVPISKCIIPILKQRKIDMLSRHPGIDGY